MKPKAKKALFLIIFILTVFVVMGYVSYGGVLEQVYFVCKNVAQSCLRSAQTACDKKFIATGGFDMAKPCQNTTVLHYFYGAFNGDKSVWWVGRPALLYFLGEVW